MHNSRWPGKGGEMVKLLSSWYFPLQLIFSNTRKSEIFQLFPPQRFYVTYIFPTERYHSITTPRLSQWKYNLNKNPSLFGSQKDNIRDYGSRYLVKTPSSTCLPTIRCSTFLKQMCWVLVPEPQQIHSFTPAFFKSLTLKRAKRYQEPQTCSKLQSLLPSLPSLEINSSNVRHKLSFSVWFLTCLTWNNCLLRPGPLGDKRIPCCPHTEWRLWGSFQAEGSPGRSGAPGRVLYRQTWPFHHSRLPPAPPFSLHTHCPKRARAPQSSSPACRPFSGQHRRILLGLRSKRTRSASDESHCRS